MKSESHIAASRSPRADAYAPAEIAARVRDMGVKKANLDLASMLALAILAGAFIALGNVVGGAGLVGGMYWFIYLRQSARDRESIA